tara:strand:+ start:379 stop:768 length:390 start_codon:yes stop_codon:yes gene_type:complete
MVKEVNADLTLCLCTKSEKTGREFLKNRNKQRRRKRMLTASVPRVTKDETQTTDETGETTSALSRQTGGNHYKNMLIQPAEYAEKNGLSLLEGNVVKYISRWKLKGAPLADLLKAKHCIDLLIELHEVE